MNLTIPGLPFPLYNKRMANNGATTISELERLRDSDLALSDWGTDIRGSRVVDPSGEISGHVSGLYVDVRERKVRMLELRTGGFLGIGERHAILPIEAVSRVHGDVVYVNEPRGRIVHSPGYDPKLVVRPSASAWEPYYSYYGISPLWGGSFVPPTLPKSTR